MILLRVKWVNGRKIFCRRDMGVMPVSVGQHSDVSFFRTNNRKIFSSLVICFRLNCTRLSIIIGEHGDVRFLKSIVEQYSSSCDCFSGELHGSLSK